MLVAGNAPSDLPGLVFTSIFLHRCGIPCCRQIAIFGEWQPRAWNPAPRNPLLLATLVAHGNYGLCRFLLADRMCILECAMWRIAREQRCYWFFLLLFARWKSFGEHQGKMDRWYQVSGMSSRAPSILNAAVINSFQKERGNTERWRANAIT